MPTYRVRKTKQQKKGRGNITQIVSVVVQSGRGRTSRPRAPTQQLDKFMLTRPTPPQVITVPSMNPYPSPELATVLANQERTLDLALQQQALLQAQMKGGYIRNPEGELQPAVTDEEKETLRQQLQEANDKVAAQATMMGDMLRKQEGTAIKPIAPVFAPPPPPPPPPKEVPDLPELPEREAPKVEEKPMPPASPPEGGVGGGDEFVEELKGTAGKTPTEIQIERTIKSLEKGKTTSAQIKQLENSKVRPATLEAYRRYYDLDPSTTREDIIEFVKQSSGYKERPRKPKPEEEPKAPEIRQPDFEEDEGSSVVVKKPLP